MSVIDAQGTTFTFGGAVVGQVTRFNFIDGTTPDVKIAPLGEETNYYLPGVAEFGSVTVTMYRDTADAGQSLMETARASSQVKECVITLRNGVTRTFDGYVKRLPIVGDDNGVGTADAVIKVTGRVT